MGANLGLSSAQREQQREAMDAKLRELIASNNAHTQALRNLLPRVTALEAAAPAPRWWWQRVRLWF